MSNQSLALTDQVTTGDVLTTPDGPCAMGAFFWPDHIAANGGDNNSVLMVSNQSASGRIWFGWDSAGSNKQTWIQNTAGGLKGAHYTSVIPAHEWNHVMMRWGQRLIDGTPNPYIEALLNGSLDGADGSGAPVAGALASFTEWMNRFDENSPLGRLCRSFLLDFAPTSAEAWYIASGGHIPSLRPSQPELILYYNDHGWDNRDRGYSKTPITVTGTRHSDDAPAQLLPPATDLNIKGKWYGACNRGGYTSGQPVDTFDYSLFTVECLDGTGLNYVSYPCKCFNNPEAGGRRIKDTDIIFDPNTGKYWMACLNQLYSINPGEPGNGISSSFDLYTSNNGREWDFVISVECGSTLTWKPRFLIDSTAPMGIRIYVGLSFGAGPYMHEIHPTNATFTEWSSPVIISGTGLPDNIYDGQVLKVNGSYYMPCIDWDYPGTGPSDIHLIVLKSSSPVTGFAVLKSGDWADFVEGHQGVGLQQRADGRWLFFLDALGGNGMSASLSDVAGDIEDALDGSWGDEQLLTVNGSPNEYPNFAMEGATFHFVPITTETETSLTLSEEDIEDLAEEIAAEIGTNGPGADQVTIDITENGDPVPDADVWITSDAEGHDMVAGTLQTDSEGTVMFLLDAGSTYYLWMQKDGINSIFGQSFVATADS